MYKTLATTFAAFMLVASPASAQEKDVNSPTGLSYKGYHCTVDCSGHKAGYEWAEKKGIETEEDCGGRSNSFTEGCKAWAREQNGDTTNDQEPPSSPPEID